MYTSRVLALSPVSGDDDDDDDVGLRGGVVVAAAVVADDDNASCRNDDMPFSFARFSPTCTIELPLFLSLSLSLIEANYL